MEEVSLTSENCRHLKIKKNSLLTLFLFNMFMVLKKRLKTKYLRWYACCLLKKSDKDLWQEY